MNFTKMEKLVKEVLEEPVMKNYYALAGNSDVILAAGKARVETGAEVVERMSESELAKSIDHTYLKAEGTPSHITKLCNEAREYNFISVCVNPNYVDQCNEELELSDVKVCTVIGFPLGQNTTAVKAVEATEAIESGAEEIDMVINIGRMKSGDYEYVYNDIKTLADIANEKKVLLKVIIETALLSDEEKAQACILSVAAGAHFVKTSTGFSTGGATVEDISLMRCIVGNKVGVKASGGIRTREDALAMIKAGANRIGASAGIKIVSGEGESSGY